MICNMATWSLVHIRVHATTLSICTVPTTTAQKSIQLGDFHAHLLRVPFGGPLLEG